MIHRVIPIVIHPFVRDMSTCFSAVCTSPAKTPFQYLCMAADWYDLKGPGEIMPLKCRKMKRKREQEAGADWHVNRGPGDSKERGPKPNASKVRR